MDTYFPTNDYYITLSVRIDKDSVFVYSPNCTLLSKDCNEYLTCYDYSDYVFNDLNVNSSMKLAFKPSHDPYNIENVGCQADADERPSFSAKVYLKCNKNVITYNMNS